MKNPITNEDQNMNKIFVPTNKPEDWKPLLAEPEKHWKTGYSAKALAYSWQEANDFPGSLKKVFISSGVALFKNVELLLAFPEYQVPLPGGSRPSQNDIFVLARSNDQLISITVEGKVSEPFGDTVAEWRKNDSEGKRRRLKFLLKELELEDNKEINAIRYQLLHRTASALIEAKKFGALNALTLVHSFSQFNECFEDYSRFLNLFNLETKPDSLVFVGTIEGINLYLCWVKGDPKYLTRRAKLMSIRVESPFISRKTAVSWDAAGMTKRRYQIWLRALRKSLRATREYEWLGQSLREGKRLELRASIFGIPQRIRLLDIHDALSQMIDEITECVFPKENGKTRPQVEDRHFWRVEGEKFVSDEEKIQIEIEELGDE